MIKKCLFVLLTFAICDNALQASDPLIDKEKEETQNITAMPSIPNLGLKLEELIKSKPVSSQQDSVNSQTEALPSQQNTPTVPEVLGSDVPLSSGPFMPKLEAVLTEVEKSSQSTSSQKDFLKTQAEEPLSQKNTSATPEVPPSHTSSSSWFGWVCQAVSVTASNAYHYTTANPETEKEKFPELTVSMLASFDETVESTKPLFCPVLETDRTPEDVSRKRAFPFSTGAENTRTYYNGYWFIESIDYGTYITVIENGKASSEVKCNSLRHAQSPFEFLKELHAKKLEGENSSEKYLTKGSMEKPMSLVSIIPVQVNITDLLN